MPGKLTPAQTAALRALVDGHDPFVAAREYHLSRQRCARGSPARYAAITIHSLRDAGLVTCGGSGYDTERGVKITEAGRTALPGSDPVALRDMLELVSIDVPLKVVKAWSWDERAAAEDWAGRSHLRASDNIIRVPPCPLHVEKHRNAAASRRVRIGAYTP